MGTFNVFDQNGVFPYGQSQVDFGLCVADGVNGFGLATRGFLWQAYDIWLKIEAAAPITTTWTSGVTSITTAWTPSQFGTFGDLPQIG